MASLRQTTAMSARPSPVNSPIEAEAGPVGQPVLTSVAANRPAPSLRSSDMGCGPGPQFATTRSMSPSPSTSPGVSCSGWSRTVTVWLGTSPLALPSRIDTLSSAGALNWPALPTAASSRPSALKSPVTIQTGESPTAMFGV